MTTAPHPWFAQVVLDCEDARALAEFYKELLGLEYRSGDERPPQGEPDPNGEDWLVLRNAQGSGLAFQQVEQLPRSTWPSAEVPQQLHVDLVVPDAPTLEHWRDRVQQLGGLVLHDRFDDPDEPLYVFADPAGHPFCIFVG